MRTWERSARFDEAIVAFAHAYADKTERDWRALVKWMKVEEGRVGLNRRVLVTRAAGQASELAEVLRELGMEPVVVPVIEVAEPTSFAVLGRGHCGAGGV